MKKLAFFGIIAFAMAFSSCGGGNQQQQQVVEDDDDSTNVYIPQDQTIYGICGNGTAMNTLQLLTDNGDTLSLDLTKAQENYQVFGGLQAGDRMAVLPNKSKTEAVIVINQNTLLGDWVMPNPIDGSSEVGIRIKEGGIAESIDQSSIIYKTWKIFNGKLEILSQREGGGDMEEVALYELIKLGADSLVYRTVGVEKQDVETLEYSRWREKPEMDLHGLKLEDSSDEFRIDN
ncbi:MAG: hypothetical protein IJQ04_04145 [Prevotella sp.]|nr:hypothetical protein [Prevotella sp.]